MNLSREQSYRQGEAGMVFKNLWDRKKGDERNTFNELDSRLRRFFPSVDEGKFLALACISGLMARVAWCDLEIHRDEVEHMKKNLGHWMKLPQKDIDIVVEVALEHTRELAGVESYKYTDFLADDFDRNKRFGLLKALFALAAADGTVAEREAEEIRIISKGLLLESKHFVAAKATVLEFLGSLR